MSRLSRRLGELDARIASRRAARIALRGVAAFAALWTLAACADRLLRPEVAGRTLLGAPLWAVALGASALALRTLFRKRPAGDIALDLERAYPELDDRLVNRVQFEALPRRTAWEDAYLAEPPPELAALPADRVLRPRETRRAALAAGIAAIMLAAPAAFLPEAWPNALGRTLLPFSDQPAWSRARLVTLRPDADVQITRGEALDIAGVAHGEAGQEVSLEIVPARGPSLVRRLATLAGGGDEPFAERITGMNADFVFRVRVGDATPSRKVAVHVAPAPGFASCLILPEPPEGMKAPPAPIDAMRTRPVLAEGSLARLRVRPNRPAQTVAFSVDDGPPRTMDADGDGDFVGAWRVAAGREIRLHATLAGGLSARERIAFDILADRPPGLRILSPEGDLALGVGGKPGLRFEATDDRGLSRISLENVPPGALESTPGTVVFSHALTGRRHEGVWTAGAPMSGEVAAYRLTVEDNRAHPGPHKTVSRTVTFTRAAAGKLLAEERDELARTRQKLAALIARQRANLAATLALAARIPADARPERETLRREQGGLREGLVALRETGGAAMDPVVPILDAALKGPMNDALVSLDRLVPADSENRRRLADAAGDAQRRVLECLLRAERALAEASRRQENAALLALIEALVKEQESVVAAMPKPPRADPALAAREDRMSEDYADFLAACARTRTLPQSAERTLAGALAEVLAKEPRLRVKAALLAAAEALDKGPAAQAPAHADKALAGLRELRELLSRRSVEEAARALAAMREALKPVRADLASLTGKQEKLLEALRDNAARADKSGGEAKDFDALFAKTRKEETQQALKIANDLQALPDLPVGNELVEDVRQVYEEMKQAAGSAEAPVTELGLQKEDWILEELKKAGKRLDDMEMWLVSSPDAVKRDIENFDRAELPEIGLIPMPEEMTDIIGDLLEQEEKRRAEADDSTGNQGTSDLPAGWGIAEGEFTSYAAKGMSGNERPEHKDQDGRSGIGRQGMADGEAVEATGSIKEGDNAIEKRMTRDPSQAGLIREQSEAEAVATGGGKLGGVARERGMPGAGPRRDSPDNRPSADGLLDQLRRQAESLHARATLGNLRTGRLGEAVRHLADASETLAETRDIRRVAELRARALGALKSVKTDLAAGLSGERIAPGERPRLDTPGVSAAPEETPPAYRDMVDEYFRQLGKTP